MPASIAYEQAEDDPDRQRYANAADRTHQQCHGRLIQPAADRYTQYDHKTDKSQTDDHQESIHRSLPSGKQQIVRRSLPLDHFTLLNTLKALWRTSLASGVTSLALGWLFGRGISCRRLPLPNF